MESVKNVLLVKKFMRELYSIDDINWLVRFKTLRFKVWPSDATDQLDTIEVTYATPVGVSLRKEAFSLGEDGSNFVIYIDLKKAFDVRSFDLRLYLKSTGMIYNDTVQFKQFQQGRDYGLYRTGSGDNRYMGKGVLALINKESLKVKFAKKVVPGKPSVSMTGFSLRDSRSRVIFDTLRAKYAPVGGRFSKQQLFPLGYFDIYLNSESICRDFAGQLNLL